MTEALVAIIASLIALAALLLVLRHGRISLGLPLAYLFTLLFNHIPGAYAYVATRGVAYGSAAIGTGMALTGIGAVCFVVGVVLGRGQLKFDRNRSRAVAMATSEDPNRVGEHEYWVFCLTGGWALVFGVSLILRLPSVGAVVQQGGAIWMLGVILGFADAYRRKDIRTAILWLSALAVYPVVMLLVGGFLSYGFAAVIIVGCVLAVVAKRYWMAMAGMLASSIVGLSIFVNYFGIRRELRDVVWTGGSMNARLDVVFGMIRHFQMFTPRNPDHMQALDLRLNQNYFIGVAAERLKSEYEPFLNGKSILDGFMALVPRLVWPDKPVFGGSGDLVRNMTGLELNENTSWGVGNVMEFYINFGVPGVVIGFLILGFALGWLDRRAALALRYGERGKVFVFFLPAVALIQPIGSLVELFSAAGAAFFAALAWRYIWQQWSRRRANPKAHRQPLMGRRAL
jgi:hypothetical protein